MTRRAHPGWKRFLCALALLCLAIQTARAEDTAPPAPPAATATPSAPPAPSPASSSPPSYPALVVDDVKHVLTAPARWNDDDWRKVEWASLAVVGTALAVDHRWRDEMRRHAPNNDAFLTQVERFGSPYAPGVIGGFLVIGALSGNENTLETGEDTLTASLIASGIVTPTIKLIVGRARPRANAGVGFFKPFSDLNASFPCGHCTEAFALASVISGHYESAWVSYVSYGIAGLVGIARTYHDAHFASDVLAGALVGTVVGNAVVDYNRERRAGKLSLSPDIAPGMAGIRLTGNF